jgi:subtilase family serine protease
MPRPSTVAKAVVMTALVSSTLLRAAVADQGRVVLSGNTRAAATAANDRGRVSDSLPMDHMQLLLKRSPASEQAVEKFVADLHDPASPDYHQWLTAEQFGERFGVAESEIRAVTNWLQSQGFIVNSVYPSKVMIDFSGTAGQVRQAFKTEIHNLEVKGEKHIANMSDPEVPAALASSIKGIVSLHNFMPHPMLKPRPAFTTSNGNYALVPGDLSKIYNFNPLFAKGIAGQGQTIVVVEDTNVYSTSDWSTFRSTFGLSGYSTGSFTQVQPGNCTSPGVNSDDGEAILDAEWASAAAPGAAIQLASCADTSTTFGGLIALENLLNASGTPPALVSMSYGECEAANGATANAAYATTFQQAVAEGVSVFVSAGDEGAASCDADQSYSQYGINVSGFASTPYNVAVGGTDFSDTYAGTNSTYWNATNSSTYESALSYIPEIPWNSSCASTLLASYNGYTQTWGAAGFCNSFTAIFEGYVTTASGSGGPSECATGSPSTPNVVSGTCKGYAKPSWQSGLFGNPNDGVRDIPDVSLFAANGAWTHYYVFCYTDPNNGGAACTGDPTNWSGAGGTSFSSPIMAGLQALVNQSTGSRWGNPNTKYYSLAAAEYGTGGTSTCLSSNSPASTCIFNDITQGDMDVPCYSTFNCYGADLTNGYYGVLSTSSTTLTPAYGTSPGWDFSTGIGSVNAYNLVTKWGGSGSAAPTVVSVSPSSGSGSTQTFTAVYSDSAGASTLSNVRLLFNTSVNGVSACYLTYYPASNSLYLENNADNGTVGPLTPGSSSSISNSQCTLNGSGTTVTFSGSKLTVAYALTFTTTFSGQKNVYLEANTSHASSGFVEEGIWTPASAGPPAVVSLSPSSGSGPNQTFTAVYSESAGASTLSNVRLLLNASVNGVSACYVTYYPASNALYLENNADNGTVGPLTPGSSSSISNSQCTLNGSGTTVTFSGSKLTVAYALTFATTFSGQKNVYLEANASRASSGFVKEGTWTP